MSWPRGFQLGVATAGFQVEGGFNGPGQPCNNWHRWEAAGRVERSGTAVRFWDRPEDLLDRAASLGCTSMRLSVEWARCEPAQGAFDVDAFARYRSILAGCRAREMRPLVTLHHFTQPRWLGEDFWLDLDSPSRFSRWVARAVAELGEECEDWVTVNEPNIYALQTYVTGMFPPGRRLATGFAIRCLDHLVAAHTLAFGAIKSLQPTSTVATNTYAFTAYEIDRLLVDLLLAPSRGVERRDLHDHLHARRAEWYAAFPAATRAERLVRHFTRSAIPLELAFPRTLAAVAGAPERPLDAVQVDYYDPITSHHLRLPGHRTAGGRNWLPGRMLWDDVVDAAGLRRYCRAAAEPGLPLQIVENGLCNRVTTAASHPRADGWTRPAYLERNLAAVRDLVASGTDVSGYWHWTLADNYEWGSYEPRFGIFGVDRSDPGRPRILDVDSMGDDSAAAFRSAAGAEISPPGA
ncbi:MAG TPA: family 1 glycosylhydrolase [Acidimicrobiales bacterium]|nr:family 1 glycosylhydrolase [Acidimicrobiales bacterium]